MAKANKAETGSRQEGAGETKRAAPKRTAPAKKATEAGAGTAPMTAIPAPSAQPAKPAAAAKPATTAAKPAAARKPAAKKGGRNEPERSSPMGSPLVDTSLAAESAARMLAGRAKHGGGSQQPQQPQGGKESGLFKQLKQNVNKPALGAGGSTLANTFAPTRGSNLPPIAGGKQIGHHQTQGGINKINVPRRTAG